MFLPNAGLSGFLVPAVSPPAPRGPAGRKEGGLASQLQAWNERAGVTLTDSSYGLEQVALRSSASLFRAVKQSYSSCVAVWSP